MSTRGVSVHAALAVLLLASAAGAAQRAPDDRRRDLDVVASAQPSDQRRVDTDSAFDEVMVREGDVKADAISTSVTTCHGCRAESSVLQVLYVPGPSARLDNVASAWTQDCWDCTGTALAVQVVVIGPATRARATNRALAAGGACATCRTATAAFQVVVQAGAVRRLPDATIAEIAAWADAQEAALRAAVVAPSAPRRAAGRAARSLGDLRRVVVRALDARTRSARVAVTR